MKTVLIIIGALIVAFLVLFIFCACRIAGECDRREETMFGNWYTTHTEDDEEAVRS